MTYSIIQLQQLAARAKLEKNTYYHQCNQENCKQYITKKQGIIGNQQPQNTITYKVRTETFGNQKLVEKGTNYNIYCCKKHAIAGEL